MPLREYKCTKCNYEFEELVKNNDIVVCKKCKGDVELRVSAFSSVIEGGTSKEPVDMKIGREANKRWQMYHDRQSRRHKLVGRKPELMKLPKGSLSPAMAVGTTQDKEKRSEYSSALNEHRKNRIKKGQCQFSEAGPF